MGMSFTLKSYLKHYVWVIVSIGVFVQMIGSALRNIFGILVDPLNVNFDWSVGEIGIAYAVMSITSALSSPFSGWLGDKFGAKKTIFFGTILFLLGMLWVSFMNNLWEFYLAYGLVLGFAQSLIGVPIVPSVIIADVTVPVSPVVITVPVTLGKVIVRSAVGSATVRVVS